MRVAGLRDLLWELLKSKITGLSWNGPAIDDRSVRLPNNLNVCMHGLNGDSLIAACQSVAISSGSACATAHKGPSHVLKAIGLSDDQADCSLRIGLGRFHREEEIRWAAEKICQAYAMLAGI